MSGETEQRFEPGSYCWSRIGIWSENPPSCPLLKDVIHCRNCREFRLQARDLFQNPPPPDYLREWTEVIAGTKDKDREAEGESVFIFRLENEWLALPAASVSEVARPSAIHRVPYKSDDIFRGLVNIRGQLKLCFSLADLLQIDKDAAWSSQDNLFGGRLVAMEENGFSMVFPVDEVADVIGYRPEDVVNVPTNISSAASSFVMTMFRFRGNTVGHLDGGLIVSALKRRIL